MLSAATLASALAAIEPTFLEAEAIEAFADAYASYAIEAAAATPILAGGVALGKAAMVSASAGLATSRDPGQAAAFIAGAVSAFWAAVAGGLTTSFAGATAITPPPHAGLAALLADDFVENLDRTREEAAEALADSLHAQAIVGGAVTTPGPTVTPIV